MPVKVKEFVIQASFENENQSQSRPIDRGGESTEINKKEIVDECFDKVLQYLQDREER